MKRIPIGLRFFMIVLCSVNCLDLLAQYENIPGYVVLLTGDTLRGTMEERSRQSDYRGCYFRDSGSGKIRHYGSGDIKGFGVDGVKYLEAIRVKDNLGNEVTVFARLLLSGRASLFYYRDDLYARHDSLGVHMLRYLSRRDVPAVQRIKGLLNFLTQDCKSMNVKFDSLVIADDMIENVLRRYDQCKGEYKPISVNKSIDSFRGNFSATMGINLLTLKFSGFPTNAGNNTLLGTSFNASASPMVTIGYAATFPRFSKNVSLLAEFSALPFKTVGNADGVSISGQPEHEEVVFSATYLRMSMGGRVLLPSRGVTPFLKAGMSLYKDFGFSGTRTRTSDVNGQSFTTVPYQWSSGGMIGFWLGGGINRKLTRNIRLSWDCRLEFVSGYEGPLPDIYSVKGTGFATSLGLIF